MFYSNIFNMEIRENNQMQITSISKSNHSIGLEALRRVED